MIRRPPSFTLFPYTTLFRSQEGQTKNFHFTFTFNDNGDLGCSGGSLDVQLDGKNDCLVSNTQISVSSGEIDEDGTIVTGDTGVTNGVSGHVDFSDVDHDSPFINSVTLGGTTVSITEGRSNTIDTGFGILTMFSDGHYTFVIDPTNPAVDGLQEGQTKNFDFAFAFNDNGDLGCSGGSVDVQLDGKNDCPVINTQTSVSSCENDEDGTIVTGDTGVTNGVSGHVDFSDVDHDN